MGNLARILILQVAQTRQMACGASSRISRIAMTEDGDLAQGTRNAIKVGICLLLVGQVLVNAYLYCPWETCVYSNGPARGSAFDPGVYLPYGNRGARSLEEISGIRRQALHLADWWLAFALWQFVARMGNGPIIILFMIGAVKIALSIKDAIQVQA
jgi:hypothetical protein